MCLPAPSHSSARLTDLLGLVAEAASLVRASRARRAVDGGQLAVLPAADAQHELEHIALLLLPQLLEVLVSAWRRRRETTTKKTQWVSAQRGGCRSAASSRSRRRVTVVRVVSPRSSASSSRCTGLASPLLCSLLCSPIFVVFCCLWQVKGKRQREKEKGKKTNSREWHAHGRSSRWR